MFSLVSGLYESYLAPVQLNVLLVGAAGVGKTACLERIKVTQFSKQAQPTVPTDALPPRPLPLHVFGLHILPKNTAVAPAAAAAAASESFSTVASSSAANATLAAAITTTQHIPTTPNKNSKEEQEETARLLGLNDTPEYVATSRRQGRASSATTTGAKAEHRSRGFLPWICPAPKKYANAAADDNDEDNHEEQNQHNQHSEQDHKHDGTAQTTIVDGKSESVKPINKNNNNHHGSTPLPETASSTIPNDLWDTPQPPLHSMHNERMSSMESIELYPDDNGDDRQTKLPEQPTKDDTAVATTTAATNHVLQNDSNNVQQPSQPRPKKQNKQRPKKEFDLKSGKIMLPLRKIRPTIGTNLAKNIEICAAVCQVFDVGGKLTNLWERYYADADAVIFVYKVTSDSNEQDQQQQERNDEDSDTSIDDGRPELTAALQMKLLEQVRSSIPDDVPFLVLGHLHHQQHAAGAVVTDVPYSCTALIPHYHNFYTQACFFANAATGQGIRSAMEWLVPLAKRLQKIRRAEAQLQQQQQQDLHRK